MSGVVEAKQGEVPQEKIKYNLLLLIMSYCFSD